MLGLVCIIVLAGIAGCGDDDGPSGPTTPKNYAFYFNDGSNPHTYYRYRALTDVVDTLSIPYRSYGGLTASADGKRLYLADNNSSVVAVVSTDSFQLLASLPFSGNRGVAVSANNRLVAINGPDLYILKTSDYSVYYHDTLGSSGGQFSADSRSYYCLSNGGVTKIDFGDSIRQSTKVFPGGTIIMVAPSIDENRLFLYRMYSEYVYSLSVYDVEEDSVVFDQAMPPGGGQIVVDPTGKYAYVSAPGSILLQIPGPSGFFVFDIAGNRMVDTVNTRDSAHAFMPIDGLAVAPNGKLLVAAEGLWGRAFVTCDLDSMAVKKYYKLSVPVSMAAVTCQNGL